MLYVANINTLATRREDSKTALAAVDGCVAPSFSAYTKHQLPVSAVQFNSYASVTFWSKRHVNLFVNNNNKKAVL